MHRRGRITSVLLCLGISGLVALFHQHLRLPESAAPAELYAVVYGQFNAFREEDFSSAYRHASSGIQQQFSVEQFAEMIRSEYSGVVNAERMELGLVQRSGRRALIQVFLIDRDGQITPCVYELIDESAGWKVDGARFHRRWPAGARLGGLQI